MDLKNVIYAMMTTVAVAVLTYSSTAYTEALVAPLRSEIAVNKAEIRSSKDNLNRIEQKIDLLIERALK